MTTPVRHLLLLHVVILGVGCTQRHVRNWDQLRAGMDTPTVRRVLGTPTSEMGPMNAAATQPSDVFAIALFFNEVMDREGWVYGPEGLFGALGNILGPSPDAYVVYFDESGHVTGWRRPRRGYVEHSNDWERYWRLYVEMVAESGNVTLIDETSSAPPIDASMKPPVLLRSVCDSKTTCTFAWESAGDGREKSYWLQISLDDAVSLTFESLTTTVQLNFGGQFVQFDPDSIAGGRSAELKWRVRSIAESSSSGWTEWAKVQSAPERD